MELMLIIASGLFGIVIGDSNQRRSWSCEKRYLQHYASLDCTPVYEKDYDCPSFYKCPKAEKNVKGCLYNGTVYQEGEDLDISDKCTTCECFFNDLSNDYDTVCSYAECFDDDESDNCYSTYEAGECCSTGTKCLTDEDNDKKNICDYNEKIYHYGQEIYPDEDHCQICICNEDWSGVHGKTCRTVDCTLGLERKRMQKEGCIPVYHEASCCPIDYYCGSSKNASEPLATQDDIQSGKSCEFKGTHYKIGQVLNINYTRNCATCTCQVPPIFTCIHKTGC